MADVSPALRSALDADIHQQNARISMLITTGVLSPSDNSLATRILRHNEQELADPVMGRYHRGDRDGSVDFLSEIPDAFLAREKTYRLAVVASFNGDHATLRKMRSSGISISSLRGRHGYAAGFAVDYPRCIQEYLDDGLDPAATWTVEDAPTDLVTRTCEVNCRPDVLKMLLEKGARGSPAALLKACETGAEDAVYALVRHDPALRLPRSVRRVRFLELVDKVRARICTEQKAEAESLARDLARSIEAHEAFVTSEMPALFAAATNVMQIEINSLRSANVKNID
jgi:hypothetical protein